MKIEKSEEIKKYISGLSATDYIYLRYIMEIRDIIAALIKNHNLTKERFCELIDLPLDLFEPFTTGDYEYTISDLATINSVFSKLEIERLEERLPFQVAKS